MTIQPLSIWTDFELKPFESRYAELIVSWVPSARELFVLAPGTEPPLTVEKVKGWTKERDDPLFLWRTGDLEPVGYAELNPMPRGSSELWIGHLIVPEPLRGQGIGHAFVLHLLKCAFQHSGASRVSLVVFPENEVAVHCYLKVGMVQDGVQLKSFDHMPGEHKMLKMTMTLRQFERRKIQLGL